jgi:hypothetical protein
MHLLARRRTQITLCRLRKLGYAGASNHEDEPHLILRNAREEPRSSSLPEPASKRINDGGAILLALPIPKAVFAIDRQGVDVGK